jgi:uncharacterized Zn finger protein
MLMSLTFANFKQIIASQILTRGRDYVRSGQVLDLSFDEDSWVWEAQVQGTYVYDVQVELLPDNHLTCSCTCPYDGGYCKHIAAVLYAIEENFPDQIGIKARKKSATRQTRHDKLRQLLETTPREKLVSILLQIAQQDRELLNQLLIDLDTGTLKATDYRRLVKDALRSGRDHDGYLDYMGSRRVGDKLTDLLNRGDQWRESGEIGKAISMYQAIIDETALIINEADDSDGVLSGAISMAFEALSETFILQGEPGRQSLLEYCLECAQREEFRGEDMSWEFLMTAETMVSTPTQRALFTAALDDLEARFSKSSAHGYMNDYALEQIAGFNLSLIERFDGAEASRQFLVAHTYLNRMRLELIARCMKDGLLEEAMRQIEAGITSSTQRHLPGLTNQYQALRIQIFQQMGDERGVIKATRALWLSRGDKDDFEYLEKMIPASKWTAFVDELIKDVDQTEQLAWLYAHEKRWNALLKLIQSQRQMQWLLDRYFDGLGAAFPDEVATLYEERLGKILQYATGRNEYKQAVDCLRHMSQVGKTERVAVLVADISKQYPKRRALLEELKKLSL